MLFERMLTLVRGGGDLASGAIYRLWRAGFPVVVTELPIPVLVRRAVSYGEAVFSQTATVQGLTARCIADEQAIWDAIHAGEIPVLIDANGEVIHQLKPAIVIDARMEKQKLDTAIGDAPLVVALGPGYRAGVDCHAVIETNRGHNLGRVIYEGTAEPDTGTPGSINGMQHSRVLRAPVVGRITPRATIGDSIEVGQIIATIGDHTISAPFAGVLRGLIHHSVQVSAGMKIGDLDPRAVREHCFSISDKSLAVGGGVLEAVMAAPQIQACFRAGASHETLSGA